MALSTCEQLSAKGLARLGDPVHISDKDSFYDCSQITIGNHVLTDDFAVLFAGEGCIELGNYSHIALYSKTNLADDFNFTSRVLIHRLSDDYPAVTMFESAATKVVSHDCQTFSLPACFFKLRKTGLFALSQKFESIGDS
ncbi:hypothetical protein A5320_08230 [Rheinheimera sp. SA_1]|uniref:hypothetical protein n=1 Tax=Rheinheimera sp. SA_1 TaxID=1827365 RepID=UPI0007FC6E39|nr:hypothetical protein [Rheinheimera sp. SA_1]OBP15341.1 hypothetical protein A5320_08230 [Rheinheimera sp. SA_1]